MSAVRRGVKNHVVRAPFDTAFKYCFKRLVGRVFGVKRKIVTKHDETVWRASGQRHQGRKTVDIFAMDFDQLEWRRASSAPEGGIHPGVGGFDKRRLPHAPRAPE